MESLRMNIIQQYELKYITFEQLSEEMRDYLIVCSIINMINTDKKKWPLFDKVNGYFFLILNFISDINLPIKLINKLFILCIFI